jgi:hypothetical protein
MNHHGQDVYERRRSAGGVSRMRDVTRPLSHAALYVTSAFVSFNRFEVAVERALKALFTRCVCVFTVALRQTIHLSHKRISG